MGYKFKRGLMYRMPTHFGPATGPRQGERGVKFSGETSHNATVVSLSFLTNREQLEELVPEDIGLELADEPVITVHAGLLQECEWLAGRGYNVLGVNFPVTFNGKKDHVKGDFQIVLWENLCEPILTGREELGYSKIYAEIPAPMVYQGVWHWTALWQGFKFVDLKFMNMRQLSLEEAKTMMSKQGSAGTIHYKYVPRTGVWGTPDVAYVTLTPAAGGPKTLKEAWQGEGTVQFHKATWQDLPTQYNIVNALHGLEIKEYRGAMMLKTIGAKDLSDTHILE